MGSSNLYHADDPDLGLRSQMCWNHKLQLLFFIKIPACCRLNYMVAIDFKKITNDIICMTDMYFREKINMLLMVLHLNASCLSICSSCFFFLVCLFVFVFYLFSLE